MNSSMFRFDIQKTLLKIMLIYCGFTLFRWVPIFVDWGAQFTNLKPQRNILYVLQSFFGQGRSTTSSTNETVIFYETTKIGTHENK